VGLKLIFLIAARAVSLLGLSRREEWWKDAEILMLRHQLAVAQRERPRAHSRLTWPDRAWLALLAGTVPAELLAAMRLIVAPGTIVRWHRDIVRRRWARRHHGGTFHDLADPQGRWHQPGTAPRRPRLPVISSRMACLVSALEHAYRVLGSEEAAGGDEVFWQLVLARIIEPVSKLDSIRVLEEAGIAPASYRTIERRLRAYAKEAWRQGLSAACAAHARLGPASLVLYDVSTLYFETDAGDGFREQGSPRNGGWNRRSPSGCSPGRTGSRSWSPRSRGTRPRPRRCSRSSRHS